MEEDPDVAWLLRDLPGAAPTNARAATPPASATLVSPAVPSLLSRADSPRLPCSLDELIERAEADAEASIPSRRFLARVLQLLPPGALSDQARSRLRKGEVVLSSAPGGFVGLAKALLGAARSAVAGAGAGEPDGMAAAAGVGDDVIEDVSQAQIDAWASASVEVVLFLCGPPPTILDELLMQGQPAMELYSYPQSGVPLEIAVQSVLRPLFSDMVRATLRHILHDRGPGRERDWDIMTAQERDAIIEERRLEAQARQQGQEALAEYFRERRERERDAEEEEVEVAEARVRERDRLAVRIVLRQLSTGGTDKPSLRQAAAFVTEILEPALDMYCAGPYDPNGEEAAAWRPGLNMPPLTSLAAMLSHQRMPQLVAGYARVVGAPTAVRALACLLHGGTLSLLGGAAASELGSASLFSLALQQLCDPARAPSVACLARYAGTHVRRWRGLTGSLMSGRDALVRLLRPPMRDVLINRMMPALRRPGEALEAPAERLAGLLGLLQVGGLCGGAPSGVALVPTPSSFPLILNHPTSFLPPTTP